jgi:hypothetical protein
MSSNCGFVNHDLWADMSGVRTLSPDYSSQ